MHLWFEKNFLEPEVFSYNVGINLHFLVLPLKAEISCEMIMEKHSC